MPSSRQTFFTAADEMALSIALKERFPKIRFATRSKGARKGDLTYVDDIPSAGGSLYMFVPPDGWEPVYYKLEYGEENHGISNYPEEFMSFRPSDKLHMERGPENHDGRPMLNQGCRPLGVRG